MLAIYPHQLGTRYDLSENHVKIMFSIVFRTKFELTIFNTFIMKVFSNLSINLDGENYHVITSLDRFEENFF